MSEKAEIERKFLVPNLPSLDGVRFAEIVQGYLAVEPEGAEVRIRRSGDRHYETVKTGAGLRRGELEIEITPGQFTALWPATQNRRIEKVRYEIPYQGRRIELDPTDPNRVFFSGNSANLIGFIEYMPAANARS